jgi:hypothetical protein
MKKYNLNLKENEELIVDVDDTIEQVMPEFIKITNKIKNEHAKYFNNWVKLYKMLNYDTIKGLTVDEIYRFNDYAAIIELTFDGKKEYDFLALNPEDMTVSCMNRKENSIRNYVVRRLLAPQTAEQALSFAKYPLPEEGMQQLVKTIKELETKGDQYKVILNDKFITKNEIEHKPVASEEPKEETKAEEPKEEPKAEEPKKETKLSDVLNKSLERMSNHVDEKKLTSANKGFYSLSATSDELEQYAKWESIFNIF